jgi:hypothetical protein
MKVSTVEQRHVDVSFFERLRRVKTAETTANNHYPMTHGGIVAPASDFLIHRAEPLSSLAIARRYLRIESSAPAHSAAVTP